MLEEPPSVPATERLLHEDPVIYRRRWFLLGIMCLSLVMVVMSVAGLNVALPSMQRDLGATASELQWIVDAYALVFAALLLFAGALGDRFGRKKALLFGLFVFASGSAVSGVATGATQVIAGRVITGVGAAFVMPATLSLLTTIFPPEERRKAIATWAGFAGAGGALGPIVSGALLEGFWWGSALLVNIPIVAAVIAAVWLFSPTSRDPEATPLDPLGALLSLIGLGALVFGIIEGPERGWTSSTVLTAFVLAAAGLVAFLAWERRAAHPMLPLKLFEDRRLSVGSGVITAAFFVMFGLFFLFTMYLQFVRDYSPLTAGLSTLPLALTLVAVAPRSAALAERIGTGPVMATGFLLVAAGFGILALIGPGTSYLVLAAALVLLGAGMSITAAPATGSIMSAVPHAKAGVGSAINDTTREVGGALGIAVLGSISNAAYKAAVDLGGLGLPPPVARAASKSVGAATAMAEQVPGGAELAARAGAAYTDAFNVTSAVSVVLALVAAAVVAKVFNRRAEQAAAAGKTRPAPEPAMELAG
ncbi:MAG TPA: DHA2 family efflux MFS transporter permease subunit [Acidimicrobiales bacterium]|nr:DHA2 family efflux MFS transporter permease subunit [Acidimicrobiales bacterium]